MDVQEMGWYRSLERLPGKRVLRILALALLFLLALELAVAVVAPTLPVYAVERFHPDYLPDTATFLASVQPEPGTLTVVVLGDSIFYGSNIHDDERSFSPLYRQALERRLGVPVRLFAFSFPGCTIQEEYLIMKHVIDRADAIVFHMNAANAFDRQGKHMDLAYLPLVTPEEAREMKGPYDELRHRLLVAAQGVSLFRYRFVFRGALFKVVLGPDMPSYRDAPPAEQERTIQGFWPGLPLVPLPEDSYNLRYARKIASMKDRAQLIAVTVQSNPDVHKVGLLENETYQANTRLLEEALAGVPFFDYNKQPAFLGPEHFSDDVHLTAEGSRVFAERLADDTAPLLERYVP